MLTATASVATPKASSYLARLSRHFAHKVAVERTGSGLRVDFRFGTCEMRAFDHRIDLACGAPTRTALLRVTWVVGEHLARFGHRERLSVLWEAAEDGSTLPSSMIEGALSEDGAGLIARLREEAVRGGPSAGSDPEAGG